MRTISILGYAMLTACIFSSCTKYQDMLTSDTENKRNNSLSFSSSSTSSAIALPTGLYAVQRSNKAQDNTILKNTSIDGIFIRTTWNSIEITEGIYDWSFIDSEIDRAVSNKKKVEIAIMAGEYSPSWLEQKGVPFLDFKVIPHAGEGNPHWTHIPVVWDAQFIASYSSLVKAFANHLKANSTRYNAISLIKINGINQETAETRLPYQDSTYINGIDTASNCPLIWIENGYTPSKVIDAWNQIAAAYVANFPDKALGTAVIPDPRGFPSVDDNGTWIKDRYNTTTQNIIDKSIANYNSQNIILFNALTDKTITNDLLTYIQGNNVLLSFQEVDSYFTGKSDTWVENMIKNGINSGSEFIEVFNQTIKSYPNGIARGRQYFN